MANVMKNYLTIYIHTHIYNPRTNAPCLEGASRVKHVASFFTFHQNRKKPVKRRRKNNNNLAYVLKN
jgi:hypothetical protein